ncbi:MAG TPA: hypothetical protein EYN06_07010 [Myxococcales bacterium]|nr:hypothetical protein [Myxococcales bacterium]
MSIATKALIEGTFLGEIVIIARGKTILSMPADKIGDLYSVVSELLAASQSHALPRSVPVKTITHEHSDESAKQSRRGRLWEAVRLHLSELDRAQGFKSLLKFVKSQKLTDRDPAHALKIALGKKVSAGELIKSPSGRYALPKASHRARRENGTTTVRKRPGHLWTMLRTYLETHPEGLTRDEIIAMANDQDWSTADNIEHAVKICLGRVKRQLTLAASGHYRLLETKTAAVGGKVIRRKKMPTPESAEQEPNSPVTVTTSEVDARFVASSQYHLPRSRQPR